MTGTNRARYQSASMNGRACSFREEPARIEDEENVKLFRSRTYPKMDIPNKLREHSKLVEFQIRDIAPLLRLNQAMNSVGLV